MIEVVVKHGLMNKDLLLLGVVVGVTGAVTQEVIKIIKENKDNKEDKDSSLLLLMKK